MNGTHPAAEALAGASESVLAKINSLYAGSGPGSLGLKLIADDLGLQREVRKPRKKIRSGVAGLLVCNSGLDAKHATAVVNLQLLSELH